MASELKGDKNQPHFSATGAPAIDVDPGLVADYAALVGNTKEGLASERAALSGADLWDGLGFNENDTGRSYVYWVSFGGWNLVSTRQQSTVPTVAANWGTVSTNTLTLAAGQVSYSFNGLATATKAAFAIISTIPISLRPATNVWGTAWGVNGANPQIQVYCDATTGQVKLGNQGLTNGFGLALTLSWPIQ